MSRRQKPPALVHHKPRNQGRVRVDGRYLYLGEWGSEECQAAYDEIVRKWKLAQSDPSNLTVDVLVLKYLRFADEYYRRPDGTPTGGAANIRDAMKPVIATIGTKLVRSVTPVDLIAVRDRMIADGLARKTINNRVGKVRAAFKWAVARGLCAADVWHGLQAVDGLKAGRSAARDTEAVTPVSVAVVEATLPHLPSPVRGAVRFQLATACRPTEALMVRACDIDMSGDVWVYSPTRHKTEHHGRQRNILVGPKGQDVVREFLTTDTTAYLFSPRLVRRDSSEHYQRQTYLNAVVRACERAFGMPDELRCIPRELKGRERRRRLDEAAAWRRQHCWCPLQLRHTAATEIRKAFGLEAAQVILGHARADVTQVYAERDLDRARAVALRIG